jgi:transcriptional regulator with XRE-family HTH domain
MAGRKRNELSGTGIQAELARRLRELRDQSGLTMRQVAAKSGYSQATLSTAESGRRTPTWEVTEAFAQSCGADAREWRQLWEMAARSAPSEPDARAADIEAAPHPGDTASPAPAAQDDIVDTGDANLRRPRRRRIAILLAAGLSVTAAGVGGWALATGQSPAPSASVARDGTDPYADHCKADEKQLDWQPVSYKDGRPFGTLMLMYSLSCQAAWGYLNGPNTTAWTTHIIAHRIPGSAIAASDFNGNAPYGSWGNVLSTRSGCVYIEAYVVDAHGEGSHARTACIQAPSPAAQK